MIINIAYPRFELKAETLNLTVDLWANMFSDIPYKTIEAAIQKLICELKYPPSIADIMQKIELISNPNRIGTDKQPIDLWNELIEALPKAWRYIDDIQWDKQYGTNNAEMAMEVFDKLSAENKRYCGTYDNFAEMARHFEYDAYQKYEKGTFLREIKEIIVK